MTTVNDPCYFNEPCNCESHVHFATAGDMGPLAHAYMDEPAGEHRMPWVGAVCDWCAANCAAELAAQLESETVVPGDGRLCSAFTGGDPVNGCENPALPMSDYCADHQDDYAWLGESECGRDLTFGPIWDPYGTTCDLPPGHTGPHEADHPMGGDTRIRWTGGGSCAGDPLPYHILSEGE